MALFDGGSGFTNRVSESFGKFGIQVERSEKGSVKNTLRFNMFDTIHDSNYIAVAAKTSAGKKAADVWNNIIENDLIPSVMASGGEPAAALIIPSQDADTVVEMCRKRYLIPTVYQLFPGYVVAGFQKADVARLMEEREKAEKNKGHGPQKTGPDKSPEIQAEPPGTAEGQTKGKPHEERRPLGNGHAYPDENPPAGAGQASAGIPNGSGQRESARASVKPAAPLGKKLAAAALLGITLGAMPLGVKTVMDKFSENGLEAEETSADKKAVTRYFDGLKNGTPEDMELLKYIAANPQLAKEELKRLADTPVGVEVAGNPAAPEDILKRASLSTNEDKRAAAAENPATPADALHRLSRDPSVKVRSAAAKNPAIPRDIMERLSHDEPEVRESLLENNMLPPDILDTVTSGASRSCGFNRKLMANPCIDPATLAYNAENPDACVREGVASNPNTPPEVLAALSDDDLPDVRRAAWKNPKISPDKIASVFKPRWIPDDKNIKLEDARKSALENPSANPADMRKAVFIAPDRYSPHVAKNPAAPASLINRMGAMSSGAGGLKKFISDAMNIKTDPEARARITEAAKNYGGDPETPLRKTLNAGFMKNVYDPYHLIQDMRRFPNHGKGGKKRPGMPSVNGGRSIDISVDGPANKRYTMDNPDNVPERFSDLPLPEKGEEDGVDLDAEKAAFATADAIVDSLMKDVLPSFKPEAKSSGDGSFNEAGAPAGGNMGNTGRGSPVSAGNGGYGNTESQGYGKPEWLFQNACEHIDALQRMF